MNGPVAGILQSAGLFSGGILDERLNKCLQSVDEMRKEIYIVQRMNTILPVSYSPGYPNDILPPRTEIMRHILSRTVMTLQEATAMFIQHTALVIAHWHDNLESLCDVALAHQQKDGGAFVIYSVLPALFGFFTSSEHAQIASLFYVKLVEKANVQRVRVFLPPFLTSILTYRFVETVMTQFVVKFGASKRHFEDRKKIDPHLVHSFAVQLVTLIIDAIPLIPAPVVTVFQAMKKCGWSDAAFRDLFLGEPFFELVGVRWLNGSPYAMDNYGFKKILESARENKNLNLALFTTDKIRFEMPSSYQQFKSLHMLYCMTVADVKMATDMVGEVGKMPPSLEDVSYDFLPKEMWYRMFWTKVFPKRRDKAKTKLKFQPLVFSLKPVKLESDHAFEREYKIMARHKVFRVTDNEKLNEYLSKRRLNDAITESAKFEKLMHFCLQKSLIKELLDTVRTMDVKMKKGLIIKSAITARNECEGLVQAYEQCSHNYRSIEIRQTQFYVIFGKLVNEQSQRLERELKTVEDGFRSIIGRIQQTMDPSCLNDLCRVKRILFWQTVEVIQSVNSVPLSRQIELIMDILRAVNIVACGPVQFHVIFENALIMSYGFYIPSRYLLFNGLIINNCLFQPLLSPEDRTIWQLAGGFISSFAEKHSTELSATIYAISSDLASLCSSQFGSSENAVF